MSLARTLSVYGLAPRVIPFLTESFLPSSNIRLHHFDHWGKCAGSYMLSIGESLGAKFARKILKKLPN